jgi:hypothetical protein
MRYFLSLFGLMSFLSVDLKTCDDAELEKHKIFKNKELQKYLTDTTLEVQIRYTQIDRDQNNTPKFTTYTWNESENYFYPASTAKMPVAFLAVQKWRELQKTNPCLSLEDPMIVGVDRVPQSPDSSHAFIKGTPPSMLEHIRLIFAISDNNAHNRLFELMGQEYINKELNSKGAFTNSHLLHRLGIGGFSTEDHYFTNPMKIGKDNCVYHQEARKSITNFKSKPKSLKGIGYTGADDKVINNPFDFSAKNYISLKDLEGNLMRVVFPEAFTENQKFNYQPEDYKLLYKILDELPKDIPYLARDTHYYDNYVKYFYKSDQKNITIPDNLHIFNKVGWAYGTLTDCSYIFDTKTGMEFMLSATILTNKDQIFNDGKYEYEEVGLPFFSVLGAEVMNYEQQRKKKYAPNFSKFLGN